MFNFFRRRFGEHRLAGTLSYQRLRKNTFTSLLTIAVIGIALSLPAGLFTLLQNVKVIGDHWDPHPQISLFLSMDSTAVEIDELVQQLRSRSDVANVHYISSEEGLDAFEKQSGFGDVLQSLPENPLPPVLEVQPSIGVQGAADIERLLDDLKRLSQVDIAQLDMGWVQRLYSMIDLAQRAVLALGILLAMAVLLVVGNTIRLATQHYKEEIKVTKLVGATDAFVRRPFLYTGFYYGCFGGFLAWIIVDMVLVALNGPVRSLVSYYNSLFSLQFLGVSAIFAMLLIGGLLGLGGSWLAVARHLNAIEPQ